MKKFKNSNVIQCGCGKLCYSEEDFIDHVDEYGCPHEMLEYYILKIPTLSDEERDELKRNGLEWLINISFKINKGFFERLSKYLLNRDLIELNKNYKFRDFTDITIKN